MNAVEVDGGWADGWRMYEREVGRNWFVTVAVCVVCDADGGLEVEILLAIFEGGFTLLRCVVVGVGGRPWPVGILVGVAEIEAGANSSGFFVGFVVKVSLALRRGFLLGVGPTPISPKSCSCFSTVSWSAAAAAECCGRSASVTSCSAMPLKNSNPAWELSRFSSSPVAVGIWNENDVSETSLSDMDVDGKWRMLRSCVGGIADGGGCGPKSYQQRQRVTPT